ncbi:DUF1640 domain-containing protein [Allochromatium humboldtianum]|uniref:DUF1640 domain-containing protein n=1 Tax=Allochromatium humboldtianum TaxID=504901 RepID=A0A850R6I0_9GAMM|nr:DUF1640 domain-containing protein [Allochromatium humboldtianum]NVZ08405.1 DUF1640 domain-containing protein [Allochromatium humboldtianum]
MSTITFDTLKFVRTLKDSGIPESQAEAITEAVRAAQQDIEPVIRPDLRELELRLDARIRETELRLEAKLAEAKADLTRWVIGAGLLQTTVIVGVLLKIAKLI